jgi:hypothetical protein
MNEGNIRHISVNLWLVLGVIVVIAAIAVGVWLLKGRG